MPTFTRVTAEAGLDHQYTALGVYGPGVAVFDFDGDEDLDIFVPNDHSGHKLYRNEGNGSFIDIAASVGLNFTTELPPVVALAPDGPWYEKIFSNMQEAKKMAR